jgi:hypothetical protein
MLVAIVAIVAVVIQYIVILHRIADPSLLGDKIWIILVRFSWRIFAIL